ncbi:MAG: hypothetical protein N3A66_07375 [Planctomycetota bacterium]|nr:hypothetical protein [Planctomycetota bacterium]
MRNSAHCAIGAGGMRHGLVSSLLEILYRGVLALSRSRRTAC